MPSTSAKTLVDVQSGLKFAKSPQWIGQQLLFLDIHDRSIKSTDLGGTVQTVQTLPYLPGCFGAQSNGNLIVGDARRQELFCLENGRQEPIADISNVARSCLSDTVATTRNGMYVGDPGFDFMNPLVDRASSGIIIHINNGGRASLVAEDLCFPNGMVITMDERTLIVAESLGHTLTAFDIRRDGSLGNRRVWAQLPDDVIPDGICLDVEGAIWAATATPRALRILEGGKIVDEVVAERPVFAISLGGPQRKHLFMCTSDSSDPIITRRSPSATIDVAVVKVPGVSAIQGHSAVHRSVV